MFGIGLKTLVHTKEKYGPLSTKICKKHGTILVFQKLWSFVSTHVRAFATFSPTAKSIYLIISTASLLRRSGLFSTSAILQALLSLN